MYLVSRPICCNSLQLLFFIFKCRIIHWIHIGALCRHNTHATISKYFPYPQSEVHVLVLVSIFISLSIMTSTIEPSYKTSWSLASFHLANMIPPTKLNLRLESTSMYSSQTRENSGKHTIELLPTELYSNESHWNGQMHDAWSKSQTRNKTCQ